MTRGDEDLLVRERDGFAVVEGRDRCPERGNAGGRDEDQVRVGVGRERDERVRTERRPRGRELHRQLAEAVGAAIRTERDDAKAIGMCAHHIERLPPDGSGSAKDRESDGVAHESIIPER